MGKKKASRAKVAKPSRRTWRLTLTENRRYYDVGGDEFKGFLCVDQLLKRFDVPPGTREIWVTLHDRLGQDRAEVAKDGNEFSNLVRVDGELELLGEVVHDLLTRFLAGRRRCWAGVEYRPNQK